MDLSDFVHSGAQTGFETLVSRFVVRARGKVVWEAGHVGDFVFEIVGVFVALRVADIFHEAGDGVAEMQRDGLGFGLVDVFEDLAIGGVEGVGFGSERELDSGLGESEIALGCAEEIEGVFGGEGDGEGARFGEADVFAGHADHAAGQIEWVFA